ncbi:uncharacterized protein BDZ99DRAFT_551396 [Mytilinidion resinicola]|uniref:Uncharacterized protein n=1 Tax=Mytilinidion resinicola TaxID=574789 RepID=A0A6A6Y1U5_9PEZI|nr:uncharacterized protein BDZ99DRAFT_551396 [Mytilinidion resinicola]KAF2802528.1 hypothetical protein BDZ99DRAFT_551396 [Mytilinidion resinicola]
MSTETKPIRQNPPFVYDITAAFLSWPCPRTTCVVPGFLDSRVDGFGRLSRYCRHCDKIWLDPFFSATGEPYTLPLFDGMIISEFRPCYQSCIHCGKDIWDIDRPLVMDDAEFEEVKNSISPAGHPSCVFELPGGKKAILVRVKSVDVEDPEVVLEKGWKKGVNKLWKVVFKGRYEEQGKLDEPNVLENLEKLRLVVWKQELLTLEGVDWVIQRPLAVTDEISKEVLEGNVEKL